MSFFAGRGQNVQKLQIIAGQASKVNRKESLDYKRKETNKVSNIATNLATQWFSYILSSDSTFFIGVSITTCLRQIIQIDKITQYETIHVIMVTACCALLLQNLILIYGTFMNKQKKIRIKHGGSFNTKNIFHVYAAKVWDINNCTSAKAKIR